MITICLTCNREHLIKDTAPGTPIYCSCGAVFPAPDVKPFCPHLLRCASCGGSINPNAARCDYCGGAVQPFDKTRYCPRCYAFLTVRAEFCCYCGAKASHADQISETSQWSCPRDGSLLKGVPIGTRHGEECAKCGGVWLRSVDFESILDEQSQARPPGERFSREARHSEYRQEKGYLPCPECGEQMSRRNYQRVSGVLIDFCSRHGVWLDRNELYDIASFLRRGGLSASEKFQESEAALKSSTSSAYGPDKFKPAPGADEVTEVVLDLLGRR